MSLLPDQYEVVVGMEVHAQLMTRSKLFCGDSAAFGGEPNTQVSPITLGHPGTLPRMNRQAIDMAVKMGLACQCRLENDNYFARKNYFYPDLPKGYQVSQHTTPICRGGALRIQADGQEKWVRLNRIHLEEDAGKSLHDVRAGHTAIDLNRAGTPLIEIVTEPDLRSAEEAYQFLAEIRRLVRYLEICDGNMEEGSLRCDANISVRRRGETRLGTKVEVKNLNSLRHVRKAIEWEARRMVELLESGQPVQQQTRSYDADRGITFATREKEEADDYRYFPEPDLTPFHLSEDYIREIRSRLPALRDERIARYTGTYGLSAYDAAVLTEERTVADYFEEVVRHLPHYKAAANWLSGPVRSWMNDQAADITSFPVTPLQLAGLIRLVEEGRLSFSAASTRLLPALLRTPGADPESLAAGMNLFQQSDAAAIGELIDQVLSRHADKVREYKKGKKGLLGLFVGEVMKLSGGQADPRLTNDLVLEKLKSS